MKNPKFPATNQILINEIDSFEDFFKKGLSFHNTCIQNLDFTTFSITWELLDIDESTCFLGCDLKDRDYLLLIKKKALIFPRIDGLPYRPFRNSLYHWRELNESIGSETRDLHIFKHFSQSRYNPPVNEALYQRIHDHAMDDALGLLLGIDEQGNSDKKCIAIMGGHGTLRTDPYYFKVALTAKLLTEIGYFIASGGGPGIMEAANLGAYFAHKSKDDLKKAILILSEAPHFTHVQFTEKALEVLAIFPQGKPSLAIPTWFYGHEPSNLFTPHIAKYFSNSIREDTLLAIALHGIIFAPGSAGTTQEIFMDAAQNHYQTFKYVSPMIFLGIHRYTVETAIYQLVKSLAKGQAYERGLFLTDEPEAIAEFIRNNGPLLP